MYSKNLRFCTFVPDTINHNNHKNVQRAIFARGKLWPEGSIITYSFLNKPSDVIHKNNQKDFLTSLKILEDDANKKNSEKGLHLKFPLDPLEYKIRDEITKKGINIIPEKIKEIIELRFEPILNLTFKNVKRDDKNPADIRIKFAFDKGCRSSYGTDAKKVTDPKQQTITFSWFDVSTIMHEFGHALGLLHEHQNPLQNKILWDEEKVYKWAKKTQGWDKNKVDSQLLLKYGETLYDVANSSNFDPDSIMLYTYPAELTINNKGSIGGQRLSSKDVEYLIKVYTPTEEQYKKGIKLKKDDFLQRIYFDMYKPDKIEPILENFTITPKSNKFFYILVIILILIIIIFLSYYFTKKKKLKRN